jgi:hypothetical protein
MPISTLEWIGLLGVVGGFAAVTESTIRKSERRIMQKVDRMHEQLIASLQKQGIDPVSLD